MKKQCLILIVCFLVFSPGLFAEKVEYVIDGDTFILENHERVRMIGIDTPEIANRKYGRQEEYFGREARAYLARLIQGKEVELRGGKEPFDRFGRRLAYVYLPDGTFVNQRMVADGFAEMMRRFPFEFQNEFNGLEEEAKKQKLGMWAEKPKKPRLWNFFN